MIVDGIDMASEARWSSKFGRDQLTAYVDHKANHPAFFDLVAYDENGQDFYGLIGKRIFREDEQGFCWLEKYHDAAIARAEFDNQTAWLNEPEPESSDPLFVEAMVKGYVSCALWVGTDIFEEDGEPEPLDERFDVDDVAEEAMASIRADVEAFIAHNSADLLTYAIALDWERAGHDFYLTRNRHGAGFWDRGLGDVGRRLTEAAHVYGESDLYVGEDGSLYVP